ncbi:MAG TPA: cytochrome c [Solirubrobacterales bacterium]|nr:cytochrome c [Solirubrobacterales bacterium]
MSDAKTPKVLFLLAILALAGAVVVSGCGGGGGTTGSTEPTSSEESPPEEEPEEEEEGEEGLSEKEARSGEGSLAAEGKEVFTANCGSCHTLKAAGTSGEVGPDLDELEPDLATVEHQVVNGGGAMPAFGKEGTLNAKEIKAVATYVSAVAGQG